MADSNIEVLRGTLDLLILKAVSWGPTHGYGVARWIEQATNDVLRIEEGSLYPALHRLERQKLVTAMWETSERRQRVRVYRLTRAGITQLTAQRSRWQQFSEAVAELFVPPAVQEEP
jgi:transcriptional regulator